MDVSGNLEGGNYGETLISPQQEHELSGRRITGVMWGPFINVPQSLDHLFKLTWLFKHLPSSCTTHLTTLSVIDSLWT